MSYNRLLRKMFAESKYSSKKIIEECNKRGRKIDKAYLSRLLNGKVQPPSEELSRMFADICGVDDKKLVLEGYIEKAPKEIREAFVSIKYMTTLAALNIFENNVDDKTLKDLEEEMMKEPIADFIISLIENKADRINITDTEIKLCKEDDNMLAVSLTEPMAIPIKDNAMFPLIPENAKISLTMEEKYNNGDIIAIKVKNEEEIIVRYALFNEDNIILTSLNKEFKTLEYKKEDVIILGKVANIITSI